METLMNL